MAVMVVPFLFLPRPNEKKETTTSILFALISLLQWTLSLAWLWQLKAWSPQQDNSVQMVVFRLTLRKSVLFHRYIVVIAPLTRQPLISPAVHLQGRKYLSVIYKGTGRIETEKIIYKSRKYKSVTSQISQPYLNKITKMADSFQSKCSRFYRFSGNNYQKNGLISLE